MTGDGFVKKQLGFRFKAVFRFSPPEHQHDRHPGQRLKIKSDIGRPKFQCHVPPAQSRSRISQLPGSSLENLLERIFDVELHGFYFGNRVGKFHQAFPFTDRMGAAALRHMIENKHLLPASQRRAVPMRDRFAADKNALIEICQLKYRTPASIHEPTADTSRKIADVHRRRPLLGPLQGVPRQVPLGPFSVRVLRLQFSVTGGQCLRRKIRAFFQRKFF